MLHNIMFWQKLLPSLMISIPHKVRVLRFKTTQTVNQQKFYTLTCKNILFFLCFTHLANAGCACVVLVGTPNPLTTLTTMLALVTWTFCGFGLLLSRRTGFRGWRGENRSTTVDFRALENNNKNISKKCI